MVVVFMGGCAARCEVRVVDGDVRRLWTYRLLTIENNASPPRVKYRIMVAVDLRATMQQTRARRSRATLKITAVRRTCVSPPIAPFFDVSDGTYSLAAQPLAKA